MTIERIKELVESSDYEFLRTDPRLGERIILLTLGGSHAYGLATETSDVDVRGCALNGPSDLLGFARFEQVSDERTDTTVYAFNKYVRLLLDCNPNTIEMLGCRPEHYLRLTADGAALVENRKLFLSRRAAHSFGGYAAQQLLRLTNALARDKLPQASREEHIRQSMENAARSFEDRYAGFDQGSVRLYTAESRREGLDREILADIRLDGYPAREFAGMLGDLNGVLRNYEKLNHRNHKKDDARLNKHAMHLVRLYLTCLDLLEKGDIVTFRGADRDLLMDIRRGAYQREDGTYRREFFDLVGELEARLAYARENTGLPEEPDAKRVEEFVMDVNRRSLDG